MSGSEATQRSIAAVVTYSCPIRLLLGAGHAMLPRSSAEEGMARKEYASDACALHTASTNARACRQLCDVDFERDSPSDTDGRRCTCCSLVLIADVASSEEPDVCTDMLKLPVLASDVPSIHTSGASACQLSSYNLSVGRTLLWNDAAFPSRPPAVVPSGDEEEEIARLARLDTCVHRPSVLRMEWWLRPDGEVSDAMPEERLRHAV